MQSMIPACDIQWRQTLPLIKAHNDHDDVSISCFSMNTSGATMILSLFSDEPTTDPLNPLDDIERHFFFVRMKSLLRPPDLYRLQGTFKLKIIPEAANCQRVRE